MAAVFRQPAQYVSTLSYDIWSGYLLYEPFWLSDESSPEGESDMGGFTSPAQRTSNEAQTPNTAEEADTAEDSPSFAAQNRDIPLYGDDDEDDRW